MCRICIQQAPVDQLLQGVLIVACFILTTVVSLSGLITIFTKGGVL